MFGCPDEVALESKVEILRFHYGPFVLFGSLTVETYVCKVNRSGEGLFPHKKEYFFNTEVLVTLFVDYL